jgi:hypothetical protein
MMADYDGRIDGEFDGRVFEMKPSITDSRKGIHSFVGKASELRRICDQAALYDSMLGNPQEWDSKRSMWRRVHRGGR